MVMTMAETAGQPSPSTKERRQQSVVAGLRRLRSVLFVTILAGGCTVTTSRPAEAPCNPPSLVKWLAPLPESGVRSRFFGGWIPVDVNLLGAERAQAVRVVDHTGTKSILLDLKSGKAIPNQGGQLPVWRDAAAVTSAVGESVSFAGRRQSGITTSVSWGGCGVFSTGLDLAIATARSEVVIVERNVQLTQLERTEDCDEYRDEPIPDVGPMLRSALIPASIGIEDTDQGPIVATRRWVALFDADALFQFGRGCSVTEVDRTTFLVSRCWIEKNAMARDPDKSIGESKKLLLSMDSSIRRNSHGARCK